jgi:type I restriction enzyme R subunit
MELDEDDQEDFRGHVQSFTRLYGYISQIIDFKDLELEKLYIFLRHLVKKLPKRRLDDIRDITSSIDLEYFRIEKKHSTSIELEKTGGELTPIGGDTVGLPPEEVKELLSEIIEVINDSYGTNLTDSDKVKLEEIQRRIQEDEEFRKVYEGDNTDTCQRRSKMGPLGGVKLVHFL